MMDEEAAKGVTLSDRINNNNRSYGSYAPAGLQGLYVHVNLSWKQ